ncbi:MAG: hypothetical protein L0H73_14675 [Nitrococcus sp.]|nr:hypothetical protein [Nitrococcus sp.]
MKRYLLLLTTLAVSGLFAAALAAAPHDYGQHAKHSQSSTHEQAMNWYGGPAYMGPPNLEVTAALV